MSDKPYSYTAQLNLEERIRLQKWLEHPNGGLPLGDRCTFEAIEGGGIYVRVNSFAYRLKRG